MKELRKNSCINDKARLVNISPDPNFLSQVSQNKLAFLSSIFCKLTTFPKIFIQDQTFHPKKSIYWVWVPVVNPNPSSKQKSIH
jgi:hypothetical protein